MKQLNRIDLDGVLAALRALGVMHRYVGPRLIVTRVCSLLHREPGGLYYFTGDAPGPFGTLSGSVVICNERALGDLAGNAAIVVEGDPQQVFYRLCAKLFDTRPAPGIHPTAIIHPEAEIGQEVHIGPYAVIGRSTIGAGTVIHAHVVIMDGCTIGARVVIEPNSCIGGTGVAWIWGDDGERIVLPQLGGVVVEDDVFLATDVTVVRGMLNEDTRIGRGTRIAHGSKIGHSAVLGADCHLANNVSIAGSAVIGDRCFFGSACVVRPHAKVAAGTRVGVGAAVVKDITTPDTTVAGVPAREIETKPRQAGIPRQGEGSA